MEPHTHIHTSTRMCIFTTCVYLHMTVWNFSDHFCQEFFSSDNAWEYLILLFSCWSSFFSLLPLPLPSTTPLPSLIPLPSLFFFSSQSRPGIHLLSLSHPFRVIIDTRTPLDRKSENQGNDEEGKESLQSCTHSQLPLALISMSFFLNSLPSYRVYFYCLGNLTLGVRLCLLSPKTHMYARQWWCL